MREILLNPAKSLSSSVTAHQTFEKLEIPFSIPQPKESGVANTAAPFIDFQVNPMLLNSTIQVTFSYSYGQTQLIVALYGPSETKGFKQDPSKAVIELVIKDTTTKEGEGIESLRSELKSILEQIVSLNSYPRGVLNF